MPMVYALLMSIICFFADGEMSCIKRNFHHCCYITISKIRFRLVGSSVIFSRAIFEFGSIYVNWIFNLFPKIAIGTVYLSLKKFKYFQNYNRNLNYYYFWRCVSMFDRIDWKRKYRTFYYSLFHYSICYLKYLFCVFPISRFNLVTSHSTFNLCIINFQTDSNIVEF